MRDQRSVVGFLAAVTQAPLTSFIIVMEMIDGHAMVLSLMACALIASLLSRLLGPPLYGTLAQAQLVRLRSMTPAVPVLITAEQDGAPDQPPSTSPPAPPSPPP